MQNFHSLILNLEESEFMYYQPKIVQFHEFNLNKIFRLLKVKKRELFSGHKDIF